MHAPPLFDDYKKSVKTTEDALSSSDCKSACLALASARRATQQICQLYPGKQCERAMAKLEELTKRVRAECPDCKTAFLPPPDKDDKEAPANEPAKPAPQPTAETGAGSAPAAPPPERSKGGCASCEVGGTDALFDPSLVAIVAWALARRRRRAA
jgi:hypothetical protein